MQSLRVRVRTAKQRTAASAKRAVGSNWIRVVWVVLCDACPHRGVNGADTDNQQREEYEQCDAGIDEKSHGAASIQRVIRVKVGLVEDGLNAGAPQCLGEINPGLQGDCLRRSAEVRFAERVAGGTSTHNGAFGESALPAAIKLYTGFSARVCGFSA